MGKFGNFMRMIPFRARELFKGEHVESSLQQLLKNSSFRKNQIIKWQSDHLIQLLSYLDKNNPYYSNYMSTMNIDFSNHNVSAYDLLSLFPVIDKHIIQDNHSQWLSKNLSYCNLALNSTSGSTGIPFKFYQTPISSDYKTASKYRLYNRFGVKISDYQLCLGTGYNSEVNNGLKKLKIDFNNLYVNHRYFFDVSKITQQDCINIIGTINRLRISSIWGYPSALFEIANYSLSHGYPINSKSLKVIFYSGEGHTFIMDDIIKKAFGVNTADEYNSVESFIAGSCEDGRLHLNEDTSVFEVLQPDGSISEYGNGELLITSLFSYDFPFIRYKSGDIVSISKESCACGSGFKVLDSVDGRSSSVIYNGSSIVPHSICTHYLPHSEFRTLVSNFQIEQNEKDSVVVRLVLKQSNTDTSGIEKMYRELFNQINVSFEYVDNIPREKSGKFRDVISNLNRGVE